MPNHIVNKLQIKDEDVLNQVIDYMKEEHIAEKVNIYSDNYFINSAYTSYMDFNKIIHMPDYIYQGPLSSNELELYGKSNCWFQWSITNWGTKWNAYDSFIDNNNKITYNTAWSGVPRLMGLLSQKFPDAEFVYKYADEDTGANVGYFIFKNGRVLENRDISDFSVSAYKIYIECHDLIPEYFKIYVDRNENTRLLQVAAIKENNNF